MDDEDFDKFKLPDVLTTISSTPARSIEVDTTKRAIDAVLKIAEGVTLAPEIAGAVPAPIINAGRKALDR